MTCGTYFLLDLILKNLKKGKIHCYNFCLVRSSWNKKKNKLENYDYTIVTKLAIRNKFYSGIFRKKKRGGGEEDEKKNEKDSS